MKSWKPCYLEKLLSRTVPCKTTNLFSHLNIVPEAYQTLCNRLPEMVVILTRLAKILAPDSSIRVGGDIALGLDEEGKVEPELELTQFRDWQYFDSLLVPVDYIFYSVGLLSPEHVSDEEDLSHANCLVVDNRRRTCELFDPHGHLTKTKDTDLVHRLALLIKVPSTYTNLSPPELCPATWIWQTRWPLCFYYVILYFILRVTCPQNSRESILVRVSKLSNRERDHLLAQVHCLVERTVAETQFEKDEKQIASLCSNITPRVTRKLKRKLEQGDSKSLRRQFKWIESDLKQKCYTKWLPGNVDRAALQSFCGERSSTDTMKDLRQIIHLVKMFLVSSIAKSRETYEQLGSKILFPLQKIDWVVSTGKEPLVIASMDQKTTEQSMEHLAQVLYAVVTKAREKKQKQMIWIRTIFHIPDVAKRILNPTEPLGYTVIPIGWFLNGGLQLSSDRRKRLIDFIPRLRPRTSIVLNRNGEQVFGDMSDSETIS